MKDKLPTCDRQTALPLEQRPPCLNTANNPGGRNHGHPPHSRRFGVKPGCPQVDTSNVPRLVPIPDLGGGDNPRKRHVAMKTLTPSIAIRAKCLECVGGYPRKSGIARRHRKNAAYSPTGWVVDVIVQGSRNPYRSSNRSGRNVSSVWGANGYLFPAARVKVVPCGHSEWASAPGRQKKCRKTRGWSARKHRMATGPHLNHSQPKHCPQKLKNRRNSTYDAIHKQMGPCTDGYPHKGQENFLVREDYAL